MSEQNQEIEDAVITEETKDAVAPTLSKEAEQKKREDLEYHRKYFQLIQQGGMFIKFIAKDLERQRKEKINRASRRRIEKALQKGIFTQDVIDAYYHKLNHIIAFFHQELKNMETPEVDAVEMYEKANAQEENVNVSES